VIVLGLTVYRTAEKKQMAEVNLPQGAAEFQQQYRL
jgi:hypothetical protein